MSVNPTKFLQEVRNEARKVTWPTRRTTLVTTAAVLAMATGASAFFFIVDQAIAFGVQILLG